MEGAWIWTQIKRAKAKALFRRGNIALHATSLPERELAVCNTIDLFLRGQNRFWSKDIWVRPMSSSATSTSMQSVSFARGGRFHTDKKENQIFLIYNI
jgi:hypothetical protein